MLIASCATRVGFHGGLIVDYPNSSKRKKYYLHLSFEHSSGAGKPQRGPRQKNGFAIGSGGGGGGGDDGESGSWKRRGKNKRAAPKSKSWIQSKKERQRAQGRDVRPDSKFTGRKRKNRR